MYGGGIRFLVFRLLGLELSIETSTSSSAALIAVPVAVKVKLSYSFWDGLSSFGFADAIAA